MTDGDPEIARRAIFNVIRNQIKANEPPETKQTFARLMAEGYSKEDAMKLIGCALTAEMFAVAKEHRPYDHARYLKALRELPKMPGS